MGHSDQAGDLLLERGDVRHHIGLALQEHFAERRFQLWQEPPMLNGGVEYRNMNH